LDGKRDETKVSVQPLLFNLLTANWEEKMVKVRRKGVRRREKAIFISVRK